MIIKVTELGPHLPLSTRRLVVWCGELCQYRTPVALVEGLRDGVVLVRDMKRGTHFELTPNEARAVAEAFNHAAFGVEAWAEHARGYHRVVVQRNEEGVVRVTTQDTTAVMRLSKLRRPRACSACRESVMALWVGVREQAKGWAPGHLRAPHNAEVCEPCVERLANAATAIAEVLPIAGSEP